MNYQQYRPSGFKLLPPVVKNLLIINGLVFLGTYVLGYTFGFDLVEYFGLYHWESQYFKPYQFITHLFMHGGFAHILFNMFALWMFGNVLENVWGGKRLLTYYLITGLGAGLIHLLVTSYQLFSIESAAQTYANAPSIEVFRAFTAEYVPSIYLGSFQQLIDSWMYDPNNTYYIKNSLSLIDQLIEIKQDIPTVGASGAVFGLLLAFGMLFPNSVIYIYFAIPIKAKYFVILYGALELWSGIQNNPADNVAHFAHLGGMLFGFLLIKYWGRNTSSFY
ncbi:MAG: rhomboid family intramembrane serine protease [Bacteroidota bacterium]